MPWMFADAALKISPIDATSASSISDNDSVDTLEVPRCLHSNPTEPRQPDGDRLRRAAGAIALQ